MRVFGDLAREEVRLGAGKEKISEQAGQRAGC